MVVDELARRFQAPGWKHKDGALQAYVAPRGVVLAKPQQFMNESGFPVARALGWWKIERPDLLVVYDELDLPLGRLRLRGEGSAAGHNGVKSIIEALGSPDFARLRVGIGRGREAIDHVLTPFQSEEWPLLERAVNAAADGAEKWLTQPFPRAVEWVNSWRDEVQSA